MKELKSNKFQDFLVLGCFAVLFVSAIGFCGYVGKNTPDMKKGIQSVVLSNNNYSN